MTSQSILEDFNHLLILKFHVVISLVMVWLCMRCEVELIEEFYRINYFFGNSLLDPWCFSSDFNIISSNNERQGGSAPNLQAMKDFNSMILDCHV